jgi:hypothetical protein
VRDSQNLMTRVSAYIPGREQFRTDHGLAGTRWKEDHQPFYFPVFHILEKEGEGERIYIYHMDGHFFDGGRLHLLSSWELVINSYLYLARQYRFPGFWSLLGHYLLDTWSLLMRTQSSNVCTKEGKEYVLAYLHS